MRRGRPLRTGRPDPAAGRRAAGHRAGGRRPGDHRADDHWAGDHRAGDHRAAAHRAAGRGPAALSDRHLRPAPRLPGAGRGPTPRRSSAACPGAGRRPAGPARWPVPTSTDARCTHSSPGASAGPAPGWPSAGADGAASGHSLILASPSTVHAPGSGVQARIRRSTAGAGSPQRTRASATVILGARLTPSAGCGRACSWPDSIPSSVATSSPAPDTAEPAEQVTGGVPGPDRLGQHAEHRPGIQLTDDLERGRAGQVVAVQDGVLHRRGAAPGREQREVQVDPAVLGDVQRGLREQRAVRGHRAAVRGDGPEPAEEILVPHPGRLEHLEAGLGRALRDRAGRRRRPRPAAASGRVTTATTSCREASSASSAGTAACGVPANTSRIRPPTAPSRRSRAARPGSPGWARPTIRPRGWPCWRACAAADRAGR